MYFSPIVNTPFIRQIWSFAKIAFEKGTKLPGAPYARNSNTELYNNCIFRGSFPVYYWNKPGMIQVNSSIGAED